MARRSDTWDVRRVAGALGAEISGADLARATKEDAEEIHELLMEHGVLFFPAQHLTVENHIRFGRFFGHLEGHPNADDIKSANKDYPELFELKASQGGVADEWHTDLTCLESPPKMSILHMRKCPEVGGDTMWTSLSKAYDALSPPLKELCDGLSALHDATPHGHPEQSSIHPVVRLHPATGKKLLYVNEHFTRRVVEMNHEESTMLLNYLTKWVQRPMFTVRYRWSEGTIAMWDNTQTQHYVLQDFEGERIIQRVTVMGDKVEAGSSSRWSPHVRPADKLSATARYDIPLLNHFSKMHAVAKL